MLWDEEDAKQETGAFVRFVPEPFWPPARPVRREPAHQPVNDWMQERRTVHEILTDFRHTVRAQTLRDLARDRLRELSEQTEQDEREERRRRVQEAIDQIEPLIQDRTKAPPRRASEKDFFGAGISQGSARASTRQLHRELRDLAAGERRGRCQRDQRHGGR
jgi:hypothetical protein